MELTQSIIVQITGEGSRAPTRTPERAAWNEGWRRYFETCAMGLEKYLSRRWPSLNRQDVQDVIAETVCKMRRGLKAPWNSERERATGWVEARTMITAQRTAIDLLRKKGRISRLESVSLHAELSDAGGTLEDLVGVEDTQRLAREEAEESHDRGEFAASILRVQGELGRRKPQNLSILTAILSGKSIESVAAEHGVARGTVDNLKTEFSKQAGTIHLLVQQGHALSEAVQMTTAKGLVRKSS